MKKFHFSLEPLLRLKEVEKKKIELELAKHQSIVKIHQEQLESEEQSIKDMLKEAEYEVQKNKRPYAMFAQPTFLEQKKSNIYRLKNEIKKLYETREEILARLNRKNNELKKVEEEKEDQIKLFNKKIAKLEQNNSEEMYSILRERKKNGVAL